MRVIGRASVMPLIAYDEPGYHDRLQRASARPLQMTTGVLNIVASLPAILAVSIALLFIEPLLLALAFGAYIPVWLAATRASRHQPRRPPLTSRRGRERSSRSIDRSSSDSPQITPREHSQHHSDSRHLQDVDGFVEEDRPGDRGDDGNGQREDARRRVSFTRG